MKAAVVVAYNDIQYMDIPAPEVCAGEIKVSVRHCGICGSDIPRVLKGNVHSFPQVLGHEFSGIVTEIGSGVSSVAIGDHVVGVPLVPCHKCEDCKNGNYSLCKHYSFIGSRQQGAMAEYVVVPEQNVIKISNSIPLDLAALFEPSTIALHGILISDFHPSATNHVLVIGAGTIALFTLQWCKILGAKNITVIIRNKEREGIVIKYGADKVLSSLDNGFEKVAMDVTKNRGFDYVLDAAGTPETIKTAMRLAANKSHVCFIGTPTQPVNFSVKEWELLNRREMIVTGSWMSYSSPFPGIEWQKTAECMADGRLHIDDDMIYTHFPLSEIKEAFKLYEENASSVKGRIMLDI